MRTLLALLKPHLVNRVPGIAAIAIDFRQLARRVREQQRRPRRLLRIGHGLRGHKNKDGRRRSNLSVGLHRAVVYIVGRCFKPHEISASDIIGDDGKHLSPRRGLAGGTDDERRECEPRWHRLRRRYARAFSFYCAMLKTLQHFNLLLHSVTDTST